MTIEETRSQGAVIVAPAGRVDSTTSGQLDEHLIGLATAGEHRVVVDFGAVDYISSAGLRVMLTTAKRIKDRRGELALCRLGESVHQVFELAGFLPLFAIDSSVDAAVTRVTTQ